MANNLRKTVKNNFALVAVLLGYDMTLATIMPARALSKSNVTHAATLSTIGLSAVSAAPGMVAQGLKQSTTKSSICPSHTNTIPGQVVSIPRDPNTNSIEGYGPIAKGEGNDFGSYTTGDNQKFIALNLLAAWRIGDYRSKTDTELKELLIKGIKRGGPFAKTIVDLFLNWETRKPLGKPVTREKVTLTLVEANTLRHNIGSLLSAEVAKSPQFKNVRDLVIQQIKNKIQEQAKNGSIEIEKLCLQQSEFPRIDFGDSWGDFLDSTSTDDILQYIIGGTQGRTLFVKDFKFISEDKSKYTATLRFVYYDDFGVDGNDVEKISRFPSLSNGVEGMIAQWILQHEKKAKPFIQEIIVDVPIEGQLKYPSKEPLQEKREGRELKSGKSWGDPHLITFDGLSYNFQTVGEFILAKSKDGDVEVQTRQTPVNSNLSLNSAVAIRVGSDRVAIYAQDLPDADTSTQLRVNGKPVVIEGNKVALSSGGAIAKDGGTYIINLPSGEKVVITPSTFNGKGYLDLVTYIYNQPNRMSGLLGNLDGNRDNDQISRDGNVLSSRSTYGDLKDVLNLVGVGKLPVNLDAADKLYLDKLYKDFGNSWRVKQQESLFDYPTGMTTANYTDKNFPKNYLTLDMLSSEQITKARNACEKAKVTQDTMSGCIYDVGFTGFSNFARTTAQINGYLDIANQLFSRNRG